MSPTSLKLNQFQKLSDEDREEVLNHESTWFKSLFIDRIESLRFGEGGYSFPERNLVHSRDWEFLCQCANVDPHYGSLENKSTRIEAPHGGFENDIFAIRPYDWSEPEVYLPNFEYKPLGFKIWWYKYAFRSSTMNYSLSKEQLLRLFRLCALHLSDTVPTPENDIMAFPAFYSSSFNIY